MRLYLRHQLQRTNGIRLIQVRCLSFVFGIIIYFFKGLMSLPRAKRGRGVRVGSRVGDIPPNVRVGDADGYLVDGDGVAPRVGDVPPNVRVGDVDGDLVDGDGVAPRVGDIPPPVRVGDDDGVLVGGDGVPPRVGEVDDDNAFLSFTRHHSSGSEMSEGGKAILGELLEESRKEIALETERNRQAVLRWQRHSMELDRNHAKEIAALQKAVPLTSVDGIPSVSSFRRRTEQIALDCQVLELENERLYGYSKSSTNLLTHVSQGN